MDELVKQGTADALAGNPWAAIAVLLVLLLSAAGQIAVAVLIYRLRQAPDPAPDSITAKALEQVLANSRRMADAGQVQAATLERMSEQHERTTALLERVLSLEAQSGESLRAVVELLKKLDGRSEAVKLNTEILLRDVGK